MKRIFLLLFAFFIQESISAQAYNTTAGLRLGTDWGLSVKQRAYDNITAELIFQSSLVRDESMFTLMGMTHQRVISKRFNLYYGGGLHAGWYSGKAQDSFGNPFGIDLIGGIEMTIAKLHLSYDIKPAINLSGGEKTFYAQTGISLRYVLVPREQLSWEPDKKTQRQNRRDKKRRKRQRR